MTRRTVARSVVSVCTALLLSAPMTASALAPAMTVRTTCTEGTRAALTLSHDDGRVEAEIELHAGRGGEVWKLHFYNESVKALSVSRRTSGTTSGGTLSVSRLLTNHAGKDRIKVTATNQVTGERCVVRATI